MSKHPPTLSWLEDVEDHDFDAAETYLSLRLGPERAADAVQALRKTKIRYFRANDLLRAARLEAAPLADPGVMHDLVKVAKGEKLSPVLVLNQKVGMEVADGFHRISLSWHLDPFAEIPVRLA